MNNCIEQEKMWGVVVKYNKERGYGFIRSKVDGIDYFVHISQVKDELLERGYIVEFCVGLNIKSKREEAKNVIVIPNLPKLLYIGFKLIPQIPYKIGV